LSVEDSNKLVIASNDQITDSSPLIYREFDNDLLKINGTLHIHNQLN